MDTLGGVSHEVERRPTPDSRGCRDRDWLRGHPPPHRGKRTKTLGPTVSPIPPRPKVHEPGRPCAPRRDVASGTAAGRRRRPRDSELSEVESFPLAPVPCCPVGGSGPYLSRTDHPVRLCPGPHDGSHRGVDSSVDPRSQLARTHPTSVSRGSDRGISHHGGQSCVVRGPRLRFGER